MLEIRVFDTIQIADSLKKTIVLILEAFNKWVNSDSEEPFNLVVSKVQKTGPPSLDINVHDTVKTKTAFGS